MIYQNSSRRNDGIATLPNTPESWANPYTATFDYPGAYNNHYQRTTGILDWQVNDTFKIHAVSAYQSMDQYYQYDGDGTSPYVAPAVPQQADWIQIHDWYSTNEIDFVSSSSGPLQWTAGAAELNYHQPFTLLDMAYNAPPANPGLTPNPQSGLFLNFHTYRRNYAGFGEITYNFTPAWQIKVGARYNHDDVGLQQGTYIAPLGPLGPQIPAGPNEPSYSAGTGRFLLNWQPDQGELIYATVSRGYKPGGWTPDVGGPPTPNNVYNAEYVLNYEAGWKATVLNQHLSSAFDVFYMNYDGFQATIATDPANPTTSVTKNVAGTKIKGVEEQFEVVESGFDLTFGFTALDAKYGYLALFMPPGTAGAAQVAPQLTNLDGRTIDYAPKLSGNVALQYTFPLGDHGTLTPRVQWTYQGGQYTSFFDQAYDYMPAYAIGTVRLTYQPNPKWELQGYVRNLTNRLYLANAYGSSPSTALVNFGEPRQEGVLVNYRF